jgi:hypothetical protein
MTIGMWLLSLLGVDTSRVTSGLYMVVLGLGMGFLMQMTTLIAQNSVELRDTAWPAAHGCSSSRSSSRSAISRSEVFS